MRYALRSTRDPGRFLVHSTDQCGIARPGCSGGSDRGWSWTGLKECTAGVETFAPVGSSGRDSDRSCCSRAARRSRARDQRGTAIPPTGCSFRDCRPAWRRSETHSSHELVEAQARPTCSSCRRADSRLGPARASTCPRCPSSRCCCRRRMRCWQPGQPSRPASQSSDSRYSKTCRP